MTCVTVLQCLMAALAVLLLIEVWARRDEPAESGWRDCSAPHFEFRPDLIVAWDDETSGADVRRCARPVPAHHRRWLPAERRRAELHVRTR